MTWTPTVCVPGPIRRHPQRFALLFSLAVAGIAALILLTQSDAPPVSDLQLPPDMRLLASAVGGNQIDSTLPGNYRYMAVAGPAHDTPAQLMTTEVNWLINHGWKYQRNTVYSMVKNGYVKASLGSPGSVADLSDPARRLSLSLDIDRSPRDVENDFFNTPVYRARAVTSWDQSNKYVLAAVMFATRTD
jgi:hypothetical protein